MTLEEQKEIPISEVDASLDDFANDVKYNDLGTRIAVSSLLSFLFTKKNFLKHI